MIAYVGPRYGVLNPERGSEATLVVLSSCCGEVVAPPKYNHATLCPKCGKATAPWAGANVGVDSVINVYNLIVQSMQYYTT